jgi:hypothetical protein
MHYNVLEKSGQCRTVPKKSGSQDWKQSEENFKGLWQVTHLRQVCVVNNMGLGGAQWVKAWIMSRCLSWNKERER